MRKKWLLILSFTPYAVILIISICSMFIGVHWFFSKTYGFGAFILTAFSCVYFTWPILIVVFVYQIYYFIISIKKK